MKVVESLESRPRRATGRLAVSVAAALLYVASCASTSTPQAATPSGQPGGAAQASNAGPPCGKLAMQLCEELGPSSDSCRSSVGVVALLPEKACVVALESFDEAREHVRELRGSCEELATAVCSELGEDSASCSALRGDLPDIPPGHCPALLHDKDQIIAALHAREAQDVPLSATQWQALLAAPAPSFGAADAKVAIVEFSDFQCPYCAEAARTLHRLRETHGAKLRIVFRHYPLSFHEHARPAAQAALAAHAQNKFWEYHDLLFAHQDALDEAALASYAQKVGLDVNKFRAAAADPASAEIVKADIALGDAVSVRGTPTVFVNGKRLPNGVDYDAVSSAVDEAFAATAQ